MLQDLLATNAALSRVYEFLAVADDLTAGFEAAIHHLRDQAPITPAGCRDAIWQQLLSALWEARGMAASGTADQITTACRFTEHQLLDNLIPPADRLRLLDRAQLLAHLRWLTKAPERVAIPRVIHLVKTDSDTSDLPLIPYLCYRSILAHCAGYRIVLHSPVRPQGKRWEQLLEAMELDIQMPPQLLGNHPLRLAAHQSDVLRVQSLLAEGGFYFDWDLLLLRSPESMRQEVCVMALEELVPGYQEVLGVAMIGAQPDSVFLQCWLNAMPAAFHPDLYVAHSTMLAREIALKAPSLLRILPWRSFYYPGWTESAIRWLFDPTLLQDEETLRQKLHDSIGIHLFASHAHFLKWTVGLTEQVIQQRRCNFALLMAEYL